MSAGSWPASALSYGSKPSTSPPTARRTVAWGASAAAAAATAPKRVSATNTRAWQSRTMYAASSAVRCQLMGVKRSPERTVAASTSANSGRLATMTATASPARTPRSRRARTSRLALAFSSAKLRSPSGDTMAGRSGCSAAQWAAVIPTLAAASKRASLSSLIRSLPSFPSVPGRPAQAGVNCGRWRPSDSGCQATRTGIPTVTS
jgi:hypothetical protein